MSTLERSTDRSERCRLTARCVLAQLRVLNGYDADLAADATRLSNRLRDALTGISPALARYPSPHALRKAGRSRIENAIRKRSPRLAKALAAAVMQALRAQTVVVPVESVMGRVVAEVVAELDRTLERRKRLASDIEELFDAHPFGRILGTLPGIGPRTGSRILAEIGDGARFATGSRLASYAGLAPVTRQSGSSLRGEGRSRRGNHRLKNAMFLAARLASGSRIEDLLRPEAGRGEEAQRRPRLPRPQALRRDPHHASLATAVPGQSSPRRGRGCLVASAHLESRPGRLDREDRDPPWGPSRDSGTRTCLVEMLASKREG